ncbi:TPA: hypothetical protein MJA79_18790 [Klebsiella pneumoniae]|uniref:DUF7210 domain-containing protein n=1 Tax=Klebsiella pneumoniae TaxID=573 RepID=A0A2X3FLB6_KLEPN|nr:hypothetical protein [Serratia marcescens]SQC23545.1 Uncharacterised protein [Klebsiella pneumoniae]SQC25609.1 Uncharacterised protein [Klebsiella pneumoniae]STR97724.1 Uncharacterised protein [Klebsiella pneumoniae]STS65858.1 Uncharacterised protein [Klebsiella pneumoniae]STS69870.1 Uncharacterised protein [Klebsiella pneumoniae]
MPEVKLLQQHTHAGKAVAAGETITVTESEARWLKAQKIIEAVLPVVNSDNQNSRRNSKVEADNGAA